MNIGIYYFSGTGNTAHIAQGMSEEFRALGHECAAFPIEKYTLAGKEAEIKDMDLVGIGFPVHAFDAPWIVYDFIAMLPRRRCEYFLFKTAGSDFLLGGSTSRLRRAIAKRGWILRHESFFEMPPNLGGDAPPERISELVSKAEEHVHKVVAEIIAGERVILRDGTMQRLFSLINHCETLGTAMGSKNWTVSSACILCGKCVRDCPTKNIVIADGKVVFRRNCVFCLRCRGNCPVGAIDHKHLKWAMTKKPYRMG